MRILACHNYYRHRGGEDQFFEDEMNLLAKHGHEVLRYTIHNDDIQDSRMLSVAAGTLWNRKSASEVTQLIKDFKPDVLHAVNTFPRFSPSIFYAAKKQGVPVVASIQNYRSFCAQAMCFRDGAACEACLGKIPWRAVKHRCYRGSLMGSLVVAAMQVLHRRLRSWQKCVDVVCVASHFSKAKLLTAGFEEQQMMLKPNFVVNDPGLQFGEDNCALFVGRLAGEKGVDTLIDAWTKFNLDVPLKIVGDGPLRGLVQAAAEKNPAITWVGQVPNEDVFDWMGRAACLIFPSVGYESMPKTLIECMAVGTPVIGADVGSIPEVVVTGETGQTFVAGDHVSLATAVKDFFATPNDWPALRKQCRSEFDLQFTADINYFQLIEIYEEAIWRSGKTPPVDTNFNTGKPQLRGSKL